MWLKINKNFDLGQMCTLCMSWEDLHVSIAVVFGFFPIVTICSSASSDCEAHVCTANCRSSPVSALQISVRSNTWHPLYLLAESVGKWWHRMSPSSNLWAVLKFKVSYEGKHKERTKIHQPSETVSQYLCVCSYSLKTGVSYTWLMWWMLQKIMQLRLSNSF